MDLKLNGSNKEITDVNNESKELELESNGEIDGINPENDTNNYFFDLYKNMMYSPQQTKRREDLLKEQKRLRSILQDSSRNIVLSDEEIDDVVETKKKKSKNHKKRKYKGLIMLSEWLVDVPEDLDSSWFVKLCPVGHHCLVVASKNKTKSYTKKGMYECSFKSVLPGGCSEYPYKKTILDCIWNEELKRIYVLDVLQWAGQDLTHHDVEFRFFWLQSRMNEIKELETSTFNNKYIFTYVPHYLCDKFAIRELFSEMHTPQVDGVLFYHKDGSYTYGPTPLVGWLKPFMLPEVLGIPVATEYMELKPQKYINLTQHISYAEDVRERKCERNNKNNKMETEEFEQITESFT